jgi:hypothetical protein
MSVPAFNGKIVLQSTNLADTSGGSKLTWNATFNFTDNSGKFLGTGIATGAQIALDTGAADMATITVYTVTSVVSSTFNSFRVVMSYNTANNNPGGPPDISIAVDQTGYVGSKSAIRGLASLGSPDIQQLPDAFACQLTNDNFLKILDTSVNAPAIAGGTAGTVLYQSAPNVTAFTAAGTTGQFLTSNGTGAPSWSTGPSGSSSNVTNTLVQRDASGNFAAGAITASLNGNALSATNLAGGSAGAVLYQSAANTTAFNTPGSSGQVLISGGAAAPTWINQSALTINQAANLAGAQWSMPYQSALNTTSMLASGTAGFVLTSNGAAAPSWQALSAVTQPAGTANTTLATTAFVDRLRSSAQTSSSTAALNDRGNTIVTAAGVTIPSGVFAAGDVFSVYNNSAVAITLTQAAGLTLHLVGTSTTGNRTLAQRGIATIYYITATEAVITGGGLS